MNNIHLARKITFEDVKKEVINRQKKYGKGDPDKCKNPIFKGIKMNEMIYILYHWPKCSECNQYLELEIEFTDFEEIPATLMYIIYNMALQEEVIADSWKELEGETNHNHN